MQIITTHERADMDALASLYAAHLLNPDYLAVLPNKLNRNVHDFATLYQDELPFISRQQVPRRSVSRVLLVDTQSIAPFRGMDRHTQLNIIDHHLPEESRDEATSTEVDLVGACTTLLVEKLRARPGALSPLGATLLLMGIYEDTGSLFYGTTTARDAAAVSWLLEQRADLELLNRFLNHPLSDSQRMALDRLIAGATLHTIQGRTVCLAAISLEHYVDELAALIHQIMDVYEPEACFVLAAYEGDVQIVARSITEAVDVAELMRAFGGGGHLKAAAARAEGQSLEQVSALLLQRMREQIRPPVRVRELMSTNVHTLDLDLSIRDAAQLMRRYGHEGFPVVQDDHLIGIVTRSDVDRALHHRLGEMPVRTLLHAGPLHVRPEDSVDEVQRVMIEHGLGQVPVVEDDRFVGIVTRTDLIKLRAPGVRVSRAHEIRRMMEEALPQGLRDLLIQARDVANDLGDSLYIVGGFVRDLLLGAPNLDLDLVVEGDAIRMAQRLGAQRGARVRCHARFGTAKVILDGEQPEGVPASLDFVTARTEFYERPTVLPTVERSSIKQDLYRRDFTINTLAICLDRDRYGELLDFYGGERDLRDGRVRVLHNLSFVEDPTRILRAARFEQRLGFVIEARTAELIDDALELVEHVTGERLHHELTLILEEAEPERCLDRLARLGVLERIHPALRFGRDKAGYFARLRSDHKALAQANGAASREGQPHPPTPELTLCYLALLTSSMDQSELASFTERLRIRTEETQFLHEVVRLRESMTALSATAMLPSTLYRLLSPYAREARFVLSVLCNATLVRQRLEVFERELAPTMPGIDGHFLRTLGLPPGPIYGEILTKLRDAWLDGQITDSEQEEALARHLAERAKRYA
jgi:tRNA nucleotidyltransferase (CCA-adding enzyme)